MCVITCWQGMNRLAAIILLFLSEEEAFWCLVAIIDFIMPAEYYSKTMLAAQADQVFVLSYTHFISISYTYINKLYSSQYV